MKLTKVWPLAIVVVLSGCEKPVVKACEAYIQDGLRAPSTYKRIGIEEASVPATYEERISLGADPRLMAIAKKHKFPVEPLYALTISYDAQNAMGVPIRSKQVCMFGGDEPSDLLLKRGLERAQQKRDGSCCLF